MVYQKLKYLSKRGILKSYLLVEIVFLDFYKLLLKFGLDLDSLKIQVNSSQLLEKFSFTLGHTEI